MDDFILCDDLLTRGSSSDEFKSLSELLHAVTVGEKLVEREHLVQLISELATSSLVDKSPGSVTAQLKSAFLSKRILWGVHH